MTSNQSGGLSAEEMAAESATALPDKEVVSILDLNADLDLAIDAAAPIDLGVAANANVAAPIDAAVGANVLSVGSGAQALTDQGTLIDQGISADATANAVQDSGLHQGATPDGAAAVDPTTDPGVGTSADQGGIPAPDGTVAPGGTVDGVQQTVGSAADGNLLNVNVDLNGDANIAAPINGAVAANANVAAPIDASVAANVGSVDSDSVAVAQQDAIINQHIDGSAEANSTQTSDIQQP
jgi:hypothetical protein